ncbi:MAG: septal ring lytic transglycosylase RlpA family protein [Alphaproteobacteria bacterium]|nr:septal ring lytic transglycosylase RlpA family protein [Alphaproteobacteria bacterium]
MTLNKKILNHLMKLNGLILCLFLTSCAETSFVADQSKAIRHKPQASRNNVQSPQTSGIKSYRIGVPYEINGIWYYPKEDFNYDVIGEASWYGEPFDGRPTASGEIYNQYDLTAAHKTLPLPSIVRVTNLDNGRSLNLKINDRGPFIGERIIDISRRGAQLLGFEQQGIGRVRVQILPQETIALAQSLDSKSFDNNNITALAENKPTINRNETIPTNIHVETSPQIVPLSPTPQLQPTQLASAKIEEQPLPVIAQQKSNISPNFTETKAPSINVSNNLNTVSAVNPQSNLSNPSNVSTQPIRQVHNVQPVTQLPPIQTTQPIQEGPKQPKLVLVSMSSNNYLYGKNSQINKGVILASNPSANRAVYVQLGAFSQYENAKGISEKLSNLGKVELTPVIVNGQQLYRVRIGPLDSKDEGGKLLTQLQQNGQQAHLVSE